MKRTKKKPLKIDAIFTADWHLRESTPSCRTDNFEQAQWDKVRQVEELAEKYTCPVYHSGDLFHHWKPSPRLLSMASERLPANFYSIYGQHDLPQHSMDLAEKSGLYNLFTNGKATHPAFSGNEIGFDSAKINIAGRRILLTHVFVYTGEAPFPGAEEEATGHWLLDKFSEYDLIVTGDNHQPFVCKEDGRLLLNCGPLTRQTAKQVDYKPRVWLYNSKKNKVKPHYLDYEKDVISRQHIENKQERDERISAFVERLGTEWEGDLDFRENLKRFERENDIEKEVMEITYKALDIE